MKTSNLQNNYDVSWENSYLAENTSATSHEEAVAVPLKTENLEVEPLSSMQVDSMGNAKIISFPKKKVDSVLAENTSATSYEEAVAVPLKTENLEVEPLSSMQVDLMGDAKIISFPKKKVDSVKLQEWLDGFRSEEEMREVFLNMDLAMKYIHEKEYCIESFNPRKIELLNNSLKQIKFDSLFLMPADLKQQKQLIHEDIYSSAFLQIGIYSKCLAYLKPDFLKENFLDFSTFLPEGDVPYYKGIVERGASVYFSSYVAEKKKRDLQSLETQFDEGGTERGKSLVKSNGTSLSAEDLIDPNTKINESIYSQLSKQDAAYVHFLIYPTIVLLIGSMVLLLVYFFSLF